MTSDEKRKQLARWILESTDEALNNRVEEVCAEHEIKNDEEIVAVTVQGERLNKT